MITLEKDFKMEKQTLNEVLASSGPENPAWVQVDTLLDGLSDKPLKNALLALFSQF